jgi:hypothetical protein
MTWGRAVGSALLTLWLVLVGLGAAWLMRYENQPGPTALAPDPWPPPSRLPREPQRWTLLLFLHPHCPCSQASLTEVAALRREVPTLATVMIFCRPEGTPDGWEKGDLWDQAAALPGATIITDTGDTERRRFGAVTSGQVLLYDGQGRLRYVGGMTRARGQTGENPGRTAITQLLRGETARTTTAPVFGCPLVETCTEQRECPCPPRP